MTKGNTKRVIGTVAGVQRDRGFFFICGPDGRDYFAWVKQLPNNRSLNTLVPQHTRFEFTPVEKPKGPAAEDLVLIEDEDGGDGEGENEHVDHLARR